MNKVYSEFRSAERRNVPKILSGHGQDFDGTGNKPRVLMVGMHLTKTRGGITTLIDEILKSPLKNEFDFTYIESQAEDFGKFRKVFLALQAIWRFIFNCLLKNVDLIYVHVGSNASLYRESFFIILAKIFGKKVISHFHAGDVENYYPFQNKVGQKFISLALSLSDSLIAVSQESAKQLGEITESPNISVITNAIDTSVFDVGERRSNNDAVRLLFVGAVGKLKGEKDLIKALAILRESKPNIKVSLLGYGAENLKDYCKELSVEEFIEFLGAVSMAQRIEFFQKADIFVLPTYAEAMPMSVIEAMASALPVITTPVGGIPELIEDGKTGLLFPAGDADALAKRISFLLNNKEARIEIGKNARRKARKEMDFQVYVDKLRFHMTGFCAVKREKKI